MPLPSNVEYDAKDRLLRARYRGPFKGVDSTSSISNMDVLALREANNADIEDNGSIKKRKGYAQKLTSTWGSRLIHQGLEFKHGSNVKLLVAGRESGAGTGILGKVDANFAAVTTINSGLNNQRPSLFSFKNLAFFYNGTNDFLYDGTGGVNPDEVRQIGITAPTNAPTLASTANGSLTVGASYLVCYTYYNANTGAESSPSPLSSPVTIAADPNDGITVNYTDADVNTATHVNFYRTVANGAVLLFDKSVATGSTSTTLTQADAGLGRQLEEDHTRPGVWGNFKYGWVAENRVFLTGLSTNPNRVHISSITATGPHPESFPAKNLVDCQSSLGDLDANLGGGMAGDATIVLKKHSVGRIEKIGVDTTTDPSDPVLFAYREISRATTALSHFAACNVFGEYIWLGKDNIYATDGVSVRSIADTIREDILVFNLAVDDTASAFNDIQNQRVYFSCKSSVSATEPDVVIVGKYKKTNLTDVEQPSLFRSVLEFSWTFYTKGTNPSTHPGIFASCFFESNEFATAHMILWGTGKFTGKLYELNSGNTDDGSGIYFLVRFAPVSFGLDEEEKLYIKDLITLYGSGADYDVVAESLYGFTDSTVETQNINLQTGVVTWNGSTWGGGTWSSTNALPKTEPHHCHNKAFFKQLQIRNEGANQPVTILNYQTMARPTAYRG